ncbi:MAG TPA: hypothetical protein DCL65_11395 [Chryseobacterium sp.]|nr:hypothetical protein [Chryseobacterium sp.]
MLPSGRVIFTIVNYEFNLQKYGFSVNFYFILFKKFVCFKVNLLKFFRRERERVLAPIEMEILFRVTRKV